jgi:hypothetical protein
VLLGKREEEGRIHRLLPHLGHGERELHPYLLLPLRLDIVRLNVQKAKQALITP